MTTTDSAALVLFLGAQAATLREMSAVGETGDPSTYFVDRLPHWLEWSSREGLDEEAVSEEVQEDLEKLHELFLGAMKIASEHFR